MKVEFFEKLKEELSSIREEGKIEELNIEEEEEEGKFQFCGYDEEEYEKEINIPTKRAFKAKKVAAAAILGLALVTGLSGVPSTSMTETNPYTVEAKSKKKDKKKPVIKFSGKTKMTVEKGKSVKIPKTTAKDNKDGNVTKKITVTVKKGKKKYNSIAKAVKKNKKVKFTSTGTYKITYTVKDKAGNKATKTRTIKVVAPKKTTTIQTPTTQSPTTQTKTTERVTTETPTTQSPTTQTSTTENVTTEQPTTGEYLFKELPEPVVGDKTYKWHAIKLNGNIYYVTNDQDWGTLFCEDGSTFEDYAPENSTKINYEISKDYEYLMFSKDSGLINNASYLKYIGDISAKIVSSGKVIPTKDMSIYSPYSTSNIKVGSDNVVYIYICHPDAGTIMIPIHLNIVNFDPNKKYDKNSFASEGYELLSTNPLVYGKKRVKKNINSLGSSKEYILEP